MAALPKTSPSPQKTRCPKLTKNPKRVLDLIHLLFASLWLGGFTIMLGLSGLMATGQFTGGTGETVLATIKSFVTICIPALMITGIIYGIFTKWGFFKHGWVTAKWILSIAVVASTALVPMEPLCLAGVVAGMVVLFAISVFKPHKKARPANS